MRPLGSGEKLAERRLRAVRAIEAGEWTSKEAATKCKVSLRAVYGWLSKYRTDGEAAIAHRKSPGRPCHLSAQDLETLRKILHKGPKKSGFETDLWTCPRVADVIKRKWGIDFHPDHVWKILTKKLGWTPQKPSKQAIERNDEEVQSWQRYQWREIKKKPARKKRQ